MSDHISRTCKDHLYCKKSRRYKQERKFQRLCDTCCHTCQSCRKEKTACCFFLFGLRALIHSQRCAGKTKDHKNKLAGKISGSICTEMCNICGISQLCKKDILSTLYHLTCHFHSAANCSLPERHIEYVMQSKRDQRSLNETKDQRSRISGTCHKTTQCKNTILNCRPYKIHQNSHKHVYDRGNNRNKSCSSKERQCAWKLDSIKAIMKTRHSKAYNNSSKYAHLKRLNTADGSNCSLKDRFCNLSIFKNQSVVDKHGVDCCIHNKISNYCRKSGNLFLFFCHPNGNAYCKNQRQVVKNSASYLIHNHEKIVENGSISQNFC